MAQAYPLDWPLGWKRTANRQQALFSSNGRDVSLSTALDRIREELRLLKVTEYDVSTDLKTRLDGLPRSGQRKPDDPGVVVYFTWKNRPYCFPCDRWNRIEDNLAAVAAHLKAMRGQERWGVGDLERAFTGYAALPAPSVKEWWVVLECQQDASMEHIEANYKVLAKQYHPDRTTGSHEKMADLNQAINQVRNRR